MALEYSKEKFGKTFTEAYVRVKKVTINVNKDSEGNKIRTGEAIVFVYPDKATRQADGETIDVMRFPMIWAGFNSENCLKQTYNHLKTLPEFSAATDDADEAQAQAPQED